MKLEQLWRAVAVPFRWAFHITQKLVDKCREFKLSVPETRSSMQYHFCIMLQLKFGNLHVSEG